MVSHHHHKAFVGVSSIIILIVGVYLGAFLIAEVSANDLIAINFGLILTTVILLLITGGLVIEVKDMLQDQQKPVRRKRR